MLLGQEFLLDMSNSKTPRKPVPTTVPCASSAVNCASVGCLMWREER